MAKNKTIETDLSVEEFLKGIPDRQMMEDSFKLLDLFRDVTGYPPKIWGTSIVGYGSYHYRYASGHEGDAPLVGFSPRKSSLVLYLSYNLEQKKELLEKLGKHKIGKACLYVKRLENVDSTVLENLVQDALKHMKILYPDHS
jgi:hypothetical protein